MKCSSEVYEPNGGAECPGCGRPAIGELVQCRPCGNWMHSTCAIRWGEVPECVRCMRQRDQYLSRGMTAELAAKGAGMGGGWGEWARQTASVAATAGGFAGGIAASTAIGAVSAASAAARTAAQVWRASQLPQPSRPEVFQVGVRVPLDQKPWAPARALWDSEDVRGRNQDSLEDRARAWAVQGESQEEPLSVPAQTPDQRSTGPTYFDMEESDRRGQPSQEVTPEEPQPQEEGLQEARPPDVAEPQQPFPEEDDAGRRAAPWEGFRREDQEPEVPPELGAHGLSTVWTPPTPGVTAAQAAGVYTAPSRYPPWTPLATNAAQPELGWDPGRVQYPWGAWGDVPPAWHQPRAQPREAWGGMHGAWNGPQFVPPPSPQYGRRAEGGVPGQEEGDPWFRSAPGRDGPLPAPMGRVPEMREREPRSITEAPKLTAGRGDSDLFEEWTVLAELHVAGIGEEALELWIWSLDHARRSYEVAMQSDSLMRGRFNPDFVVPMHLRRIDLRLRAALLQAMSHSIKKRVLEKRKTEVAAILWNAMMEIQPGSSYEKRKLIDEVWKRGSTTTPVRLRVRSEMESKSQSDVRAGHRSPRRYPAERLVKNSDGQREATRCSCISTSTME